MTHFSAIESTALAAADVQLSNAERQFFAEH